MISTRYAIPVITLLILALIPTLLHSYIGATYNDGKSVHNIAKTLTNFASSPSQRNKTWGKDVYGSDDWFERIYVNGQDQEVRLFVARSYDQKRLYHHPELALSYGQNFTKKSISALPNYPEIPVHLLSNDDNSKIVAYVLMSDNKFIKDPIKHQLGNSLRLLISARKPLTLFYASQSELPLNTNFTQSSCATILTLAIQSFLAQNDSI